MTTTSGVRIAGTGSYLPERVVTNDDLSRMLDTTDEWVRTRTGIASRHFAREDEASSHMGVAAARRALEAAELAPADVDLVICATMTPDYSIPSTAALIARDLGAVNAGGFDLNSACTGFVLGLTAGSAYLKAGAARNVLVVGAEKMSAVTDMTDRTTAVLFADGAGAALLVPASGGPDLLATRHGLHGDDEILVIPSSGVRHPPSAATLEARDNFIKMKGREVYKFAVKAFSQLIADTCQAAGVCTQDITLVVPHQVNQRILEAASERAEISLDRCVVNIDRVGNTSGASVAIALDEAVRAGRVQRGDLVLFLAFGAGLSWASALYRW